MKIASELARAGFIETVRGRKGGIRLAREPQGINVASVIQALEPHCALIDCASCRLVRRCNLPGALDQAASAFTAVLAQYSLADIVREQGQRPALHLAKA
jgi:Rrf2 family nitric oxide-sensitive transcriptional repressor